MTEVVTEAIVLDLEDLGEADSRVYLFTRDFGKMVAKVKSAKKITSKLAGQLQPMNMVTVRILEKKGMHVADALKSGEVRKDLRHLPSLSLIKTLAPEGQQDLRLWMLLKELVTGTRTHPVPEVLSELGFDPKFSVCAHCGTKAIAGFSTDDMNFYCQPYSQRLSSIVYVSA